MYYKKEGMVWNDYSTLAELFQEICKTYADFVAFSWKKGRKVIEKTYRDWEMDLLETAGKIMTLREKHIGIVCDTSYACILCLYATVIAGKVAVPLEAAQQRETVEKYVDRADIELILYHESELDERPQNCKRMSFEELLQMESCHLNEWPLWEKNRPACIFMTSGTCGNGGEKSCVLLSQKNIAVVNASFQGPAKREQRPDTIVYLPLNHVLSFAGVISCMAIGSKLYLSKGPQYLSLELLEYKPVFLLAVPLVGELLKKGIEKGIEKNGKQEEVRKGIKLAKLLWKFKIDVWPYLFKEIYKGLGGRLRLIHVGGAPVDRETLRFYEDFGICCLEGYGLTETSSVIAQNSRFCSRIGSVGFILPYSKVRIVDGEIQVRGDSVMLGYYKDEAATREVMEDGWLKTGDLGYMDKDGYLYITGRKKNLIILSNGVNISPEELECELRKSDYVGEVVVREKEGHLHAEIYPLFQEECDMEKKRELIQKEIREYNYSAALEHRITSWELREEPFAKTSTMKIKRDAK